MTESQKSITDQLNFRKREKTKYSKKIGKSFIQTEDKKDTFIEIVKYQIEFNDQNYSFKNSSESKTCRTVQGIFNLSVPVSEDLWNEILPKFKIEMPAFRIENKKRHEHLEIDGKNNFKTYFTNVKPGRSMQNWIDGVEGYAPCISLVAMLGKKEFLESIRLNIEDKIFKCNNNKSIKKIKCFLDHIGIFIGKKGAKKWEDRGKNEIFEYEQVQKAIDDNISDWGDTINLGLKFVIAGISNDDCAGKDNCAGKDKYVSTTKHFYYGDYNEFEATINVHLKKVIGVKTIEKWIILSKEFAKQLKNLSKKFNEKIQEGIKDYASLQDNSLNLSDTCEKIKTTLETNDKNKIEKNIEINRIDTDLAAFNNFLTLLERKSKPVIDKMQAIQKEKDIQEDPQEILEKYNSLFYNEKKTKRKKNNDKNRKNLKKENENRKNKKILQNIIDNMKNSMDEIKTTIDNMRKSTDAFVKILPDVKIFLSNYVNKGYVNRIKWNTKYNEWDSLINALRQSVIPFQLFVEEYVKYILMNRLSNGNSLNSTVPSDKTNGFTTVRKKGKKKKGDPRAQMWDLNKWDKYCVISNPKNDKFKTCSFKSEICSFESKKEYECKDNCWIKKCKDKNVEPEAKV